MPNWFIGKIRYQQLIDDSNVGTRNEEFIKQKTITEAYLFDAVSHTEAEARMYQEIAANTPDFEVTSINRMILADVFFNEEDGGEVWYKVKAMYILEDEKTGKKKKSPSVMLIKAQNPKQAYERVEHSLKTSLDPFEITDVNTTKILDVFPYEAENKLVAALDNLKAEGTSVSVSIDGGETCRSLTGETYKERRDQLANEVGVSTNE